MCSGAGRARSSCSALACQGQPGYQSAFVDVGDPLPPDAARTRVALEGTPAFLEQAPMRVGRTLHFAGGVTADWLLTQVASALALAQPVLSNALTPRALIGRTAMPPTTADGEARSAWLTRCRARRSSAPQREQHRVERRPGELHLVAATGGHRPRRADAFGEVVADRVEAHTVPTRYHELRKRGPPDRSNGGRAQEGGRREARAPAAPQRQSARGTAHRDHSLPPSGSGSPSLHREGHCPRQREPAPRGSGGWMVLAQRECAAPATSATASRPDGGQRRTAPQALRRMTHKVCTVAHERDDVVGIAQEVLAFRGRALTIPTPVEHRS